MSGHQGTRRPIETIRLLDHWIEAAEEIIASRWSGMGAPIIALPASDVRQPLPELLAVLHLMRRHRYDVLEEAGYALQHTHAGQRGCSRDRLLATMSV